MADAVFVRESNEARLLAAASVAVGEVWQLPSGKAGVYVRQAGSVVTPAQAASTGEYADFRTDGQWTLTKASGFVVALWRAKDLRRSGGERMVEPQRAGRVVQLAVAADSLAFGSAAAEPIRWA